MFDYANLFKEWVIESKLIEPLRFPEVYVPWSDMVGHNVARTAVFVDVVEAIQLYVYFVTTTDDNMCMFIYIYIYTCVCDR